MQDQNFRDLLKRYNNGQCSAEEAAQLESWYLGLNESDPQRLPETAIAESRRLNWAEINAATKPVALRFWIQVAAAAILILSIAGTFLFYKQNQRLDKSVMAKVDDVRPGGNKAFLTLADGKRISLTDVGKGELARQAGIKISKTADGQLIYTLTDEVNEGIAKTGETLYNTIETPRGGQYQVLLPDGTKVWLNAASALKYPASFAGAVKRKVELRGEAYFEVAHNANQPFVVSTPLHTTGGQVHEVEVLGTHFNINAYADEPAIVTTLLQGSVRVNQTVLKPGYQSVFGNNKIKVVEADVDASTAWKNGDFVFDGQDAAASLRMLGRWYDVEIDNYDNIEHVHFGGVVSRSQNLSAVIKMLQATGDLKFKVEGRRIIMIK